MDKIYYSDPLFDEMLALVPAEISRRHDLLVDIGSRIEEILKRKGWSQTDFAKAMGKKDSEISKWMGGGHNFTIATIARIEAVLEEDILTVKRYRKKISEYKQMPDAQEKWLSENHSPRYGTAKK